MTMRSAVACTARREVPATKKLSTYAAVQTGWLSSNFTPGSLSKILGTPGTALSMACCVMHWAMCMAQDHPMGRTFKTGSNNVLRLSFTPSIVWPLIFMCAAEITGREK